MRYARIVGLVMALALLAGALPAWAQGGNPVVTDEGSNIYLVDGSKGPIPNLLPAEEVAKIATLQGAPAGTYNRISSPISPDDQVVFVATRAGTQFINIHDGSAVNLRGISGFQVPLSNFFWLDANTLGLYGLDTNNTIALFAIDRASGAGRVARELPDLPGLPVFASSDGGKVLLGIPSDEALAANAALVQPLPNAMQDPAIHALGPRYELARAGLFAMPAVGTRARNLLEFAAAFDPVEQEVAQEMLIKGADIAVLDMATGVVRPVGTIPSGMLPKEVSFSKDGSKFALATDLYFPDQERYRYDGALLSEIVYRDVTGNLPPAENPYLQGNVLITLDFPSGELKTLRAADGDGWLYTGVSWSPDNQTLAVRVEQPGRLAGRHYPQYAVQYRAGAAVRFYNSALQEIRRLERIEVSHLHLRVKFATPDEVIIQSQYRLDTNPYYYNLRSGEFRNIADRAGSFDVVTPSNLSREIAFIYNSYTSPTDIYAMSMDGSAFRRLTWVTEQVRQYSQTRQYPVSFTLRDRSTHSGVLILPADVPFPPRNVPIVVWQEGGPTNEMRNHWEATVESPFGLLPNFGFGVLVVPLYGRYGVGPERFNALAAGNNLGQIDIDAQAEIVNQLRAKGWASKVGISGCSYGGYFTNQSITRHPNTYDAAHAMCSMVDLVSEWSRGYASLAPWMEGLPPQNAMAEYIKDSPAYNATKVRTPLLAFHGTNDFLPVTVMENYMLQIINNKVPAKLLKFTGTGHGFPVTAGALEKPYELYGAQEQLIWFRTYLK